MTLCTIPPCTNTETGVGRPALPAAGTASLAAGLWGIAPRRSVWFMTHKGSCHCGLIAYEVEGDITQVTDCNCSHCSRKGVLLWFGPRSILHLKTPESALSEYTFNTHRIRHQLCAVCGCEPFAFGKDSRGMDTVAINVRCLPDIDVSTLKVTHFDGRSL